MEKEMRLEKRLKYDKVGDVVLDIDLHNDYIARVIAKYDTETSDYKVTIYIKERTVEKFMLVDTQENVVFKSTYRTINSAILKYVSDLLVNKGFDEVIGQYEYEIRCFDRGNELEEEEKLGETAYKPKKGRVAYQTVYYCGKCRDSYLQFDHIYCPTCRALIDWSDVD